jgi:hypothetical protein
MRQQRLPLLLTLKLAKLCALSCKLCIKDYSFTADLSHAIEHIVYLSLGSEEKCAQTRNEDGTLKPFVYVELIQSFCMIKGGGSAMLWILLNQQVVRML